ncbi:hypothetical protein Tco_0260205 [Tanacetum coccineum]
MSDSEDSTVTYTEVSSPFGDLSDIGSLGVDGLPMMPEDPYAYVDEVFPAEEQPLPTVVSPTIDLPGYITDSNPEYPEEDPADYPSDKIDNDDDDDDEDDDDDVEMSIREQPPTPFWSEAEIAKLLDMPSPPPSPLYLWSSPLPQIPSPLPQILSPPLLVSFPPLPTSPTYPLGYRAAMIRLRAETQSTSHPLPIKLGVFEVTLPPRKRLCIALGLRYEVGESSYAPTARPTIGFRADYGFVATLDYEIRRDPERDVGYGITDTWDEMLVGVPGAPANDDTELGRRMTDFVTTVRQDTNDIYGRLDDAQDDILMETKTRLSCEAWTKIRKLRAVDRRRQAQLVETLTLMRTLQTQVTALQSQQGPASGLAQPEIPKEAGTPKRTTRANPAATTATTSVINAQLKAMINQGVTDALAARDADRNMNGDDSHNSGIGVKRTERVARECTYPDFMKCQPLNFKGTEGVVEFIQWFEKMECALTWWNSHVRTVGHDVAYAMTWTYLKKKMTDKYYPKGEIKKLEGEMWNLKVKGVGVLTPVREIEVGLEVLILVLVVKIEVAYFSPDLMYYKMGRRFDDLQIEDPYIVMSDLEDSTVTYTAALPSPDYVSGPEYPPLPEFVPESLYPEFMPQEDDVLPTEEQPLPTAVSPTADSPGYIPESDSKEDPEEDDDEDPEEDPADYPTDRDDDDDEEEEPSGDEADDEEEDEDDEEERDNEEEEEYHQTPISLPSDTKVARLLAIPTPPSSPLPHGHHHYLRFPHHHYHSLPSTTPIILFHILSRTRSDAPPSGTPPILPIPIPNSSLSLLLPSTDHGADRPKVCLPPRKRLCFAFGPRYEVEESLSVPATRPTGGFKADYGFIDTLYREIRRDPEKEVGYGITDTWDEMLEDMLGASATDETELGRRMTNFVTTVRQDTDEIYVRLGEAQDERSLMSGRLNLIQKDRRTHAHTALLMKREARLSREAYGWSMDTSVRRTERVARECTYPNFMKCQPLNFKGTEGVVKLIQWFEKMETMFSISNYSVENQIKFSTCTLLAGALTWWNSHVRTIGHDVAYEMTWIDQKKNMTDKYFPRVEIKKLEAELWNLKVKEDKSWLPEYPRNVVASILRPMQEAIEKQLTDG